MLKLTLQNKGERLYDNFIEKVFDRPRLGLPIPNPQTNTLELFGLLHTKKKEKLLIGAMCREVADTLNDENIFVENGELFNKVVYKEKY